MRELKINGIYRHYKGDYYLVLGVARHSETQEECVIYQALYGDGEVWVRPLELFLGELDSEEALRVRQKYRFELQTIKSVRGIGA